MKDSNGQRISLDFYLGNICNQIFTYLRVDEVIQLYEPDAQSFLHANPNIKSALNNFITSKGGFLYCKWVYTCLHDYNTFKRNLLQGLHLQTPNQFVVLDDYCVRQELPVVANVSYNTRYLERLLELNEIIAKLKSSETVKLGVGLKFHHDFNYYAIDIAQWLDLLTNVRSRIYLLSIDLDHCYIHYNDEINLDDFKDVEVLKLCNCFIKGSFLQLVNLKELTYAPVPSQEEDFSIWDLPKSLKSLRLIATHHVGRLVVKSPHDSCPRLEEIDLEYTRRESNETTRSPFDIIKYMIGPMTTKISVRDQAFRIEYAQDFVSFLNGVAAEYEFTLNSLSLGLGDNILRLPVFPLKELEFDGFKSQFSPLVNFPHNLKRLRLIDFSGNAKQVCDLFPLGLEHLRLSGRHANWLDFDFSFQRFLKLKELNLSDNHLGDLTGQILFPDSVEILILNHNSFKSLDAFVFPKAMRSLDISRNYIRKLKGGNLPPTLTILDASRNRIRKIDLLENNDNELLQLDNLNIDFNSPRLPESTLSRLPECLRKFSMLGFPRPVSGAQLDVGIDKEFRAKSDDEEVPPFLRLLPFPHFIFLLRLDFLGGDLRNPNIEFPSALKEVDLSNNRFSQTPVHLFALKNLRVLRMRRNRLVTAELHSPVIEVVDYSFNQIQSVRFQFPGVTETKLRSLNLTHNDLADFTMEDIGDVDGCCTKHKLLYEIALTNNKKLDERCINALISKLPPSTKCLWYNRIIYKNWWHLDRKVIVNELSGNLVKGMCLYNEIIIG